MAVAVQTKRLRVAEGREATTVLASAEFDVVPFAARYRALSGRLGLDFSTIVRVLDHVPLCVGQEGHAALRSDVARMVAEGRARLSDDLPGMVARHFAPLGRPGRADLMADCIRPFVDDLLSALTGAGFRPAEGALISRVFSQSLGVAQRRQLEAELSGLLDRIAKAHPGEGDRAHAIRAGLAIVGTDATLGTLGRSLHAHLVALDGAPLDTRPLPTVPTRTGVPYIDRVARTVPPGGEAEQVRCLLRSFEGGDDADRLRFFGVGAHLCLGRALTLDIFRLLSGFLSTLSTRVTVEDFALRRDDVFALPDRFGVRVAA